jgi:CheY-like chemotaxis protein
MDTNVDDLTKAGQGRRAIPSTPQAERPVNIEAASSALGWSTEDDLDASADLQEQPDVEAGAVLGREKTILIADDDSLVIAVLTRRLQHLGYHVIHSPDAAFALMGALKLHPDLAILDVCMPSGNGLAVCEMMACDRGCADIPVIIHSVFADKDVKRRCQRLGAYHVEKSPGSWAEIKALVEILIGENKTTQSQPTVEKPSANPGRVCRADPPLQRPSVGGCPQALRFESPKGRLETVDRQLSSSETGSKNDQPVVAGSQSSEAATPQKPLTILCIDDDPVVARSIAIRLQPYGIKMKGADNGTQGYLLGVTAQPDLVLLDLKMPNGEGNYVLGKLKDNPRTKDIPVIILTMDATAGVRRQMLSLGADAFLTKPVNWPEMFAEMGRCINLPKQLLIDYDLPEQLTLSQL